MVRITAEDIADCLLKLNSINVIPSHTFGYRESTSTNHKIISVIFWTMLRIKIIISVVGEPVPQVLKEVFGVLLFI